MLPMARRLAEQHMPREQAPRQADPQPKLLAAPLPRPERGQQVLHNRTGRMRVPVGSWGSVPLPAEVQREIERAVAAHFARKQG